MRASGHAYTRRPGYPWPFCSRCWALRGAVAECRELPVERPEDAAAEAAYLEEEREGIRCG